MATKSPLWPCGNHLFPFASLSLSFSRSHSHSRSLSHRHSLVDCFLVDSAAVSVSFSPTGNFLASSHVDCLGIYLW